MTFVDLPIEKAPQQMLEEALAELEAQIEGWDPSLGEYEVILIQSIVYRLVLPLVQLAAQVPATIFDTFGREIVGVTRQDATKATVKSTWKVTDDAGYTIKAGTQVDLARTGDERYGFVVAESVVIEPGSEETAAGAVTLEAVEPGLGANGLEGPGILIDALTYVSSVAIVGETAGGADAEVPADYLSRLAETMRTYIEGVVVAGDVAIVARNVPGIGRATVIDNYNAETEEEEEEKTTTVAVTGDDGLPATAGAKEALEALLEEKREVNYLFFVIDATYSEVDVEAIVVPMIGFDQAAVAAEVEEAIEALLDPATSGQQPPGDPASWVNATTLRYQDLVTAVNNVEGVDYASTLKWRIGEAALGTADLELPGVAPLPKPGAIEVE